eukprot:scaffold126_cov246-Pinguiococcus_pyrenoidosus.AAC.7
MELLDSGGSEQRVSNCGAPLSTQHSALGTANGSCARQVATKRVGQSKQQGSWGGMGNSESGILEQAATLQVKVPLETAEHHGVKPRFLTTPCLARNISSGWSRRCAV